MLRERRGTCVDLALLIASCLEWIELYPVIFNTTKHAFVGCWKYESTPDPELDKDGNPVLFNDETGVEILSHSKFFEKYKKGEFARQETVIEGYPWVLNDFRVLRDLVFDGAIIPLEAVCLTEYKMYSFAKDYATNYFMQEVNGELDRAEKMNSGPDGFYPGEFESLTDVMSSRRHLQPLPLSLL